MQLRACDLTEELFAEIYRTHKDEIFRHCYFIVFDRDVAVDVVQDTFIKTWEYVRTGKDLENVRAFLYKVATNLGYNYKRKKKESSLDALLDEGFDPGKHDENHGRDFIEEKRVLTALAHIREPLRTAVSLRYIEGLQPAEIAEITGERVNTVSAHITRGIKQLRSHLHHGEGS